MHGLFFVTKRAANSFESIIKTIAYASLAGLVAITVFIVVRSFVVGHVPLATGLEQLLQWDASNAFGDSAFNGGWGMALVGLLMDVVVSTAWAVLFVYIYSAVAVVRAQPLPIGLLFGVVVFFVMIYVLVPFGHAHAPPRSVVATVSGLIAHTVFFGLPIAWVVSARAANAARHA